MTARQPMPAQLKFVFLAWIGLNLVFAYWIQPPGWLHLLHIAVGFTLVGVALRQAVRTPQKPRGAQVLLGVAAAILLVALVSLGVYVLS